MCERVRVCQGEVYSGVGIVPPTDRTPSATSLFHLISQPTDNQIVTQLQLNQYCRQQTLKVLTINVLSVGGGVCDSTSGCVRQRSILYIIPHLNITHPFFKGVYQVFRSLLKGQKAVKQDQVSRGRFSCRRKEDAGRSKQLLKAVRTDSICVSFFQGQFLPLSQSS